MFYALLYEKPKVIEALVRLFGSSRFLSGYLLRHPELLDTFLRNDLSALVKTKSDLRSEVGRSWRRAPTSSRSSTCCGA